MKCHILVDMSFRTVILFGCLMLIGIANSYGQYTIQGEVMLRMEGHFLIFLLLLLHTLQIQRSLIKMAVFVSILMKSPNVWCLYCKVSLKGIRHGNGMA